MNEDTSNDDLFTARLAAYDAALADGAPSSADFGDDESLHRAKACLDQLAAVWPRRLGALPLSNAPGDAGPPSQLGRFRLIRELGRGGGIVYLADDPKLRRQVALKVPRPESLFTPELRRRFVREAEFAAQLNHRHIVPVHEAGEVGGICYLVSTYCSGPNLAQWLRERSMQPRPAALIVAALADGVAHMHGRGILHRDIKPTNVLLEFDEQAAAAGELGFVPRLTDFGLAKDTARAGTDTGTDGDRTCTGAILGTPAYVAPEQAEGQLERIGPETDVYALGVVLYELLAGRPPFRDTTDVATLQQIVTEEPQPLRRRAVPRDLEAVCLKCLAKRPADRYATAEALALDLSHFLEGKPTSARPVRPWQRAVKWARRRPLAATFAASAGVVVLCVIGAVSWYVLEQHQHSTQLTKLNTDLAAVQRERQQLGLVQAQREQLRLDAYADRIERAFETWKMGNVVQAVEWLNELQPVAGQSDLRGFEWHYLKGLCRPLHAVWRGHPAGVYCLAVTMNGKLLATSQC